MKKLVSLLLALTLLLCSAALAETAVDVTGEWYLALISPVGQDYAVSAADAGYAMEFSLIDDGTAEIRMPEGGFHGTWAFGAGTLVLTVQDSPEIFRLSDDGVYLYTATDMVEMYFMRKPEGLSSVSSDEKTEMVAVSSLADLAGTWKVEAIETEDNTFEWDYFISVTGLEIKENTIVITEDDVTVFGNEKLTGFTLTETGFLTQTAEDGKAGTSIALFSDGRMAMVTSNMLWLCVPAE